MVSFTDASLDGAESRNKTFIEEYLAKFEFPAIPQVPFELTNMSFGEMGMRGISSVWLRKDGVSPQAEELRRFALHAPPARPAGNPDLKGWWFPPTEYICVSCAGRILDRGCSLPKDVVPVYGTEPQGVCCVCSGIWEARMTFMLFGTSNKCPYEDQPFHEDCYENYAVGRATTPLGAIMAMYHDAKRIGASLWD